MPPQLPWPGEPSSARRRRSAGESAAAWKQEMMSIGSPVRESMPGRIDPSDMITAGTLCSRIAASVPTGGLSQATTAMAPRTSLPSRCRQTPSLVVSRPISEYRISGVPLRCPSEIPLAKLGAMTRTGRSLSVTRRRSSAWIASTFAGTPA